jgi:hypothetical protein
VSNAEIGHRIGYSGTGLAPRRRIGMPRPKPSAFTGTAEPNAMIERVASDILALLADGAPRSAAAIAEALAGRHDRQDVLLTLIRLSVTGEVDDGSGKCRLAAPGEAGPPEVA